MNVLRILAGVSFVILGLVSGPVLAQEPKAKGSKKYNTNIYEDQKGTSFTAKVKTFKDSRGDTLVYFEDIKKSGPYVLTESVKDYSILRSRIAKSAAVRGPQVTVSVDDQDNITSVTVNEQ